LALSKQPVAAPQPAEGSTTSSLLRELFEVVVLAVILYFGISFAVQTVHVEGLSMFGTLNDNDYLIANKIDYRLHPPQRGDIIILRPPTLSTTDYIKRVIALPGERLLIKDGHVYINGHLLDEPYLPEAWTVGTEYGGPNGIVIPANEYFVMGDNRNRSQDSRVFGPITRDRIDGKAWFRIWPLTHFGNIYSEVPALETSTVFVG
jgi:signal peptidase I